MNELTESAIEKFRDAFARGIAGIVEAGEIYVKAIDADASAADTFRERFSDCLPASAWTGFEAVGRKWMHPKLMLGGMADRKTAARVKLLPYSMQTRVFNKERFDLLLLDCTPEQSEQLFDGPVIRDVSAQRAYLETTTRKAKAMPEAEPLPYVISGGRITFRKTTSMSKSEMKRIIQGM
jgi:hypothetical protein